ncbi:D-lactate dehydrogenase [cytochrome], mitochondrial-like [Vigna umbellata]|nr:D-lactate dehydrogenase [cytochrome], mitochondrial-like [Vigna umbellata]
MSNFSSWFFRLRYSSSKLFYRYRTLHNKYAPTVFNNCSARNARSTSLLPFALALSAGSLALHPHFSPSFCDSDRGVNVGGKGSTQYVVKGSQKEFPRELLEELKIICQENISVDYDERYIHGKPQNSFHKAVNIPDVIVYPR